MFAEYIKILACLKDAQQRGIIKTFLKTISVWLKEIEDKSYLFVMI